MNVLELLVQSASKWHDVCTVTTTSKSYELNLQGFESELGKKLIKLSWLPWDVWPSSSSEALFSRFLNKGSSLHVPSLEVKLFDFNT